MLLRTQPSAPDPSGRPTDHDVPNEMGQTIQPGLNSGQNLIIKSGRVLPQTLESAGKRPSSGTNLSRSPSESFSTIPEQPVDSGTIPAGRHVHLDAGPPVGRTNYTLEPSGYAAKSS